MPSRHAVLRIAQYHLSHTAAEALVVRLLRMLGASRPKRGWHSVAYTLQTPKGTVRLQWSEMVKEARLTGGVSAIQTWLSSNNPLFGRMLGIATNSPNLSIEATFLNHKHRLKGPARSFPVEQELVGDVLAYRRLACESSDSDSFEETTRYFRSYLFSCISLIEAFMNRYLEMAIHGKDPDARIKELQQESRIENRILLWLRVFSQGEGIGNVRCTEQWDAFQKLRRARNSHIHASEPFFGYSIPKLANPLNACRKGIGGLLLLLELASGQQSTFLFERVATAPMVRFTKG